MVAHVVPAPEPYDPRDGRGWVITFDDGIEHRIVIARDSLVSGAARSFECDGATQKLTGRGLKRPPVPFAIAGRPATLSMSLEFEPFGAFVRRALGGGLRWTPASLAAAGLGGGLLGGVLGATAKQRSLVVTYALTVDGDEAGSWAALFPNNILSGWMFLPAIPRGDHRPATSW